MRRAALAWMVGALVFPAALSFAAPPDHVCGPDEGKRTCTGGRARMCTKDGEQVACVCPPGASATSTASSCAVDSKAPPAPSCTVADAAIAKTLASLLDFGELAVPSLPTLAPASSGDAARTLDPLLETLDVVELSKLAAAHEALEGAAAYQASEASGARAGRFSKTRDLEVDRALAVRQHLLAKYARYAKYAKDSVLDEQRVALARSLFRRAAYKHVPTSTDRALAKRALQEVVSAARGGISMRDAAFILAEEAVREGAWATVLALESDVLASASARVDVDDPAYLAAARARIAHARLSQGDLVAAKAALTEAIAVGVACTPRAECVSASAGARAVLAATWAASASSPRSMAPILRKGVMPRVQRVRPMVKLGEVYGAAPGTACAINAEEARAWAHSFP